MKTIMIVDDNEADRYLAEVVLQQLDPSLNLMFAKDGVHALEVLSSSEHSPDIILLDINMPRMNGHEFLAAYTQDNALDTPQIPVVIMLTSSDQERDKELSGDYNCVKDYMLKPVNEEALKKFFQIMDE